MKPISADSHVTEPPGTYVERIDYRFKDRAPRMVRDPRRGDMFVIEGLEKPVPMGLIAAAVAAGGRLTKAVQNQFYGHRSGEITDPFGYRWTLSTEVEEVSDDEIQRRAAETEKTRRASSG